MKVRLNLALTRLGLCSRGEADEFIRKGLVLLNGVPNTASDVRQKSLLVDLASTQLNLSPRAQHIQESKKTLILNKPIYYSAYPSETRPDDFPPARKLLRPENKSCGKLLDPAKLRKLVVADALDSMMSGLLVFTQDGRVASRLLNAPVADQVCFDVVEKEYEIVARGGVCDSVLEIIRGELEATFLSDAARHQPCMAKVNRCGSDQKVVRVILTSEDKKHGLVRVCERAGLEVERIQRVRIGRYKLDSATLLAGKWTVLQNPMMELFGTPS